MGQNPVYTTSVSRSLVLEESPATGSSSVVSPMPGVQADSARDGTGLSATGCSLAPCTGERASVAAGLDHSCAVLEGGRVFCFGRNAQGQLGLGFTGRPVPDVYYALEVDLDGHTARRVTAGGDLLLDSAFTCALVDGGAGPASGGVMCWGSVSYGQVGTGAVGLSVETPAPASGGVVSGAVAISAGGNHTCAVLQSGAVKCWGANESGQLGSGSQVAIQATPVSMANVSNNGLAVASGLRHSCLALSTGAVKCFGSNASGQLGLELAQITPTNAAVPFPSATPVVPEAQFQDCRVFRAYEPEP